MITSTFTLLRKADACAEGYKKLAVHLGGVRKYGVSTDIPVAVILTSNGPDDTLWVLANACGSDGEKVVHTFACDCAERVIHLYEDKYPDDRRPRKAIETKRAWLRGEATDDELTAARAAAWAAGATRVAAARATRVAAARATRVAAGDASWAASVAAWDASWAASVAASAAARAAARAAWDARDAAWDASAAARAAELEWQKQRLTELLGEEK